MRAEEFKPFFDAWYRIAMINGAKFLWCPDDIEPTVLDAFTATWKNLHKLPTQADAARFLMYVLKRRCLNANRAVKRSREVPVYGIHSDEKDYNLVEIGGMVTIDLIEKFQHFVSKYCTANQKVLIGYFMQGKSNIEIGVCMGINHRTVSATKLLVFENFKKWLRRNEDKL